MAGATGGGGVGPRPPPTAPARTAVFPPRPTPYSGSGVWEGTVAKRGRRKRRRP